MGVSMIEIRQICIRIPIYPMGKVRWKECRSGLSPGVGGIACTEHGPRHMKAGISMRRVEANLHRRVDLGSIGSIKEAGSTYGPGIQFDLPRGWRARCARGIQGVFDIL